MYVSNPLAFVFYMSCAKSFKKVKQNKQKNIIEIQLLINEKNELSLITEMNS